MTKWKRQRMEEGEEEGEGERQSWGREGKGIWGTETNTYKTHKHSCLSEFVHKFSNLSCSLQGDGSPKAKEKGVVSWRSWSALDDTNVRRLYASFGLALYYYISTLSHPSLLRIAFVVCLYLHSKLVGYSVKYIYIYTMVISHITLCCDSSAIIIAIASALCKTSSGNRRQSSKCFTSRLKSERLAKSNAQREPKRAKLREKVWANSKTYHWPTLSGNLFMPAAKLVPKCSVRYDG